MRIAPLVAIAALVSVLSAHGPASPVRLTKAEAAAVAEQIAKDRAGTEAWLRSSPTSYLAAVSRTDFGSRPALSVGRAPDNDVRIDSDDVLPHHLRVTVEGDRFRVQAVDPAARFKIDAADVREASVEPSNIRVGRHTLRLSHQHFPAIIVFDARSPRFGAYKGLKYFPVRLSYRFELPLTEDPSPAPITIMSTLGHPRRALRAGTFQFIVDGHPYLLEATRLLEPGIGEEDLSIFFRDETSGRESYPLGRYVDVQKLPNGSYLLDFNSAYNPACAYSPYYNCPIPPKANRLNVAIRAGEMDSHYY